MARTPKGSISVVSIKGRLKLRFPRQWFGGEQVYLSLEISDTADNQLYAKGKARDIEIEYHKGEFDWKLTKYKLQHGQIAKTQTIGLSDLWGRYCAYKAHKLKPKTLHYWVSTIGRHIDRCPHQDIHQALGVRGWLLAATTPNMTSRTLAALATAVDWGIRHNSISIAVNPFIGMSADIAVERSEPQPNALSTGEKLQTIAAFHSDRYYSHYANLVEFWLMTGCRPSEGIGLEWVQINDDCTKVRFDRSIVKIDGKVIKNKKSKTNRVRTFPCQDNLTEILVDLKERRSNNSLVFPSPTGIPIDYSNFAQRGWASIVDPILGRHSTPYSCRDTFITEQLAAGKPIAIVAKWVDNSPQIIQSRYLDMAAIDDILPD
jgi:integrase